MQTVLLVLFLEISLVTSEIVIPGAIFSYLGDGMKWLMNVTHIVNEEAKGDGSGCVEIIIRKLHHIGVNETGLEICN